MAEQQADYKFTLKDGGSAVAAPGKAAKGAAQSFRLKITGPTPVIGRINIGDGSAHFSDLRWSAKETAHGETITMHARVKDYEGGPVRFVVESNDGKGWKPYATVPGEVKDGEATAVLRAHHPLAPPTGDAATKADDIKKAKPADLRFKVEEGDAKPQPQAKPLAVHASRKAPPAEPRKLKLKLADDEGVPHAERPWKIVCARQTLQGTTTKDGLIEAELPPKGAATLTITTASGDIVYELAPGVEEANTPRGAQERLAALGYECIAADELNESTIAALKAFQSDEGLNVSGQLDKDTAAALDKAFGALQGAK